MTKLSKALCLLALPLLAVSQSTSSGSQQHASGSQQPSVTVLTITSVSTIETFGPNRQLITTSSATTITTTSTIQPATPTGNSTSSNSTSTNTTSTSSTSTKPLPTAPTNINGGGGADGAPSPGATGGAYGPDDNYIAAAQGLKRNAYLVGFGGIFIGGAMMLF